MLVGFIGLPASRKTTFAAEVFVHLKRWGITTEFVTEIARRYIAAKRRSSGVESIVLTDDDQLEIMRLQADSESLMDSPSCLTISDSSPLNSWMYMSPETRERAAPAFDSSLKAYSCLVSCLAHELPQALDKNRVHSADQILALNASRLDLLEKIQQEAPNLPILTVGDRKNETFLTAQAIVHINLQLKAVQT